MTTHEKINMRLDYMDFINMTNEMHERFNLKNPNKPVNLNLIHLVAEGNKKLKEQQLSGMYKCPECSNEFNKDVFHFRNPVFKELINKPLYKKHATNLQVLADYFYN